MSDRQQERIVNLQRQVKIARDALTRIKLGYSKAEALAEHALDEMWKLDPKQQLQGVVGHGEPRE